MKIAQRQQRRVQRKEWPETVPYRRISIEDVDSPLLASEKRKGKKFCDSLRLLLIVLSGITPGPKTYFMESGAQS